MKALIDGDILVYQAAFGGEFKEQNEAGEDVLTILNFEYVAALLDKAIADICLAVGADDYIVYLTGGENFRNVIATVKPYKGNRQKPKPFHYKNARVYLMSLPNAVMTDGIEADDAMVIEQMEAYRKAIVYYQASPEVSDHMYITDLCRTVICTRDKDLRMCPGWHYGWEFHLQPEFEMQWVDALGAIRYNEEKNEIKGEGLLFFYSQLITGDSTDNIPGIPRKGAKAAFLALEECHSEAEAFEVVRELYIIKYEDEWEERMLEQGQLLWMVREVDDDGLPVMWELPNG